MKSERETKFEKNTVRLSIYFLNFGGGFGAIFNLNPKFIPKPTVFHRCDIISPAKCDYSHSYHSTSQSGLLEGVQDLKVDKLLFGAADIYEAYNIHLRAKNQVLPLRTWQKIQRQPLGRPRWSVAPG